MQYSLSEIQVITSASLLQGNLGDTIKYLSIDSRSSLNEHTLFIAITGVRNNGHKYIQDVYEKGCRNFLVSETIDGAIFRDATFLLVPDTTMALQQLATAHRKKFSIPIIGITGSNGKTIVKEWLSYLLNDSFVVCKNPKSYNSQVGVPLSVWQLNEKHTIGIFEAGISQAGEMENLRNIIQPDIAVLTNIGQAHDENFTGNEQKISEKVQLFKFAKRIVYCNDHPIADNIIKNSIPTFVNRFTWSKRNNSSLLITKVVAEGNDTVIEGLVSGNRQRIIIPFKDAASVENAITCWITLIALDKNDEQHRNKFRFLQAIEMRLELKQGINNCTIINDSYNSDLGSLSIAIDYLNQQHRNSKKTLILSDILQSGKQTEQLYKEVAHMLASKGVQRIIGVGEEISSQADSFAIEKLFYKNTQEFIRDFRNIDFYNEAVLLKGARSFEFEKINSLLQHKSHETQLVINLNNLIHNVNYYRSLLKPETKMMAMVKAQSYGSGSFEIASLLQYHRVNYLAVAYADEGVELRKAGITLPIMVMSPERESFDSMLVYQLEPELYSFEVLRSFATAVSALGNKETYIHLKIDTGMHRLGFLPGEVAELLEELKKYPSLKVASVFSHLSASDNSFYDEFTHQQIDSFKETCALIEMELGYTFIKHICNSGGISRFPEAHFDMVRLGIGMYGIGVNDTEQKKLLPVCTLKTVVSQVKKVYANETVGYNRSGKISKETEIAVIPIGYADGFNRKLSNGQGKVWIGDRPAPVVGNVCMDMCMIDVTGMQVNAGDEVIVFDDVDKIHQMASAIGTISYEVLTSISTRVKKVYVQE
ncbi:MAG TPA: bifunctional UDP-N-acetylmuramoyl-tripeptide:D-alanyl-D-alanine ligase/alanine racemase [Bacteroidia bacterium]